MEYYIIGYYVGLMIWLALTFFCISRTEELKQEIWKWILILNLGTILFFTFLPIRWIVPISYLFLYSLYFRKPKDEVLKAQNTSNN